MGLRFGSRQCGGFGFQGFVVGCFGFGVLVGSGVL